MTIILIAGLLLMAAAVTVLVRAATFSHTRAVRTLGQIDEYGFTPQLDEAAKAKRPAREALDDIADRIGRGMSGRLGSLNEAELRARLRSAGLYSTSARKFVGYQVLSALGIPLVWTWLSATAGFSTFMLVLGIVGGLAAGWFVPLLLVRSRAQRRVQEIDYNLPELIDLLVVTVEAGLGFTASLQVASERLDGALGQELRLTLQEQTMGLSPSEALQNWLARTDTPAVRAFVRSVVQGETLGVSIGQILRNLATEMRSRRRQAAEERAQKAPVKLLFPLIFLIFPAMFVVLLGPAAFQLLEALGGK